MQESYVERSILIQSVRLIPFVFLDAGLLGNVDAMLIQRFCSLAITRISSATSDKS